MHDEECDHRRECRDLLLRLCHADGDTNREDDRQIAEDRAAGARHDREQRVQCRARTEDAAEPVSLNRRRIRERRADAEQNARNRQNRDRQHKAAPDALEHTKDFIFHNVTPFPLRIHLHPYSLPFGRYMEKHRKDRENYAGVSLMNCGIYKIIHDNYTVDGARV